MYLYIKVDTIERQVRKRVDSILQNILGRKAKFNICKTQRSENKIIIKLTQMAHKTEQLNICTCPPDRVSQASKYHFKLLTITSVNMFWGCIH